MENDLGLFGQLKSKCHPLQCWHFRVIFLPSLSFRHSSRGSRGGDDFLSAVAEEDFDVLSDLLDDIDLLYLTLSTEREASGTFQGRSWRSGHGGRLD
jgi:hypothetical protein